MKACHALAFEADSPLADRRRSNLQFIGTIKVTHS
jgi:hypothetical protein